jgi:hypothetical protein
MYQSAFWGYLMKLWTVTFVSILAFVFAACGTTTNPGNDNGQGHDTNVGDTVVPDADHVDIPVGTDTNVPGDTTIAEDTAVAHDDTAVQTDENTGTDVTVSCPVGASTGSLCHEAGSCAVLCEDETFRSECFASTDQTVKDAFAAFEECFATSGCAQVFGNEQITQCVVDACGTETAACFGTGELKCRDIWECRRACPADDPACPMKCVSAASMEAQIVWVTYKDCILAVSCAADEVIANGWITVECENFGRGFCSLPAQDCFPPI